MESISRSFAVLERIGGGAPVSQADLMRELDIARSTISDLLRELRDLGYVAKNGRLYVSGPKLLSFVVRASRRLSRPENIRAILSELATDLGETAIFVLPVPGTDGSPDQVIAVEQVESQNELRYVADIGKLFEAKTRVAGRVLLAFCNDMHDTLDESDRARILDHGYAVSENDARGAITFAAPVHDGSGQVIGAISIIGPAYRMEGHEDRFRAALRMATARLGAPAPAARTS